MEQQQNQEDQLSEIAEKLGKSLTLDSSIENHDYYVIVDEDDDDEDDEDGDEDEDGDFEFSFGGEEVKSPVSADEVFHNGKIRPTIPFYAGEEGAAPPPVKKVFVVSSTAENDNVVEGPYCVWGTEDLSSSSENATVLPEMSRKSNSTGFSRLRKMKDLLVRSNSDGKDTFVFLTGKSSKVKEASVKKGKKKEKEKEKEGVAFVVVEASEKKEKKKGKASMTAAYEALYGKKEKKGGDKSYLPYRVGFFTNVNGLSKNVHPY